MKKSVKILLMILLLLVAAGVGRAVLALDREIRMERPDSVQKQYENPAPPDEEYLEILGLEDFQSELPVIMIDTQDQQIIKEEPRFVRMAILDSPTGVNDIHGNPDIVLDATLKLRGASSYKFDKVQYRVKFYKKDLIRDRNYSLLGMGAHSEWVLNGPFLDQTLLRNYLMYNLCSQAMDWAPDCRFCEVFVDGRYQGVYLALEPVTNGADRLRLSKFGLLSGATSYIVARDRVGTDDNVILTYAQQNGFAGNDLSIRYPASKNLTQAQADWIERDVSKFEEALYSENFDDPNVGYAQYIDMENFADYVILNEFAMNSDAGNLSTFVYKELEGKLQMCVWDFNNGFDNYQWFPKSPEVFNCPENYWLGRMLQDRNFVDLVVSRYHEMRKTTLSDENIRFLLDRGNLELGAARDRNFARWGYIFQDGMLSPGFHDESRNPGNYEEAYQKLTDTIDQRLQYMDAHIEVLYENCVN